MSLNMPPDAWLSLIIARAHELRRAGILSLSIDGASFTLSPLEPEPTASTRTDDDHEDVFNDPATYGRLTGVPGFSRPKDES